MTAASKPPLWLVFAVQTVSVIGDQLGQRASRFDFEHSSRRMLIALTAVSSLQVFVVLGTLQLTLSPSVTGALYEDGDKVQCFREVDLEGHKPSYCEGVREHLCTPIDCPSQGPFSMPRSISLHPLLLLNGFINVAYYVGEVMLYHHPLGLVLIVIAALAASFIIRPIESLMGLASSKPIPAAVILLGIFGALFCVVEKQVRASVQLRAVYARWRAALCPWCPGEAVGAAPLVDDDEDAGGDPPALAAAAPAAAGSRRRGGDKERLLAASAGSESELRIDGAHGAADGWLDQSDPAAAAAGEQDADAYRPVPYDRTEGDQNMSPVNGAKPTFMERLAGVMRVFLPFTALSITYGLWFVTQKVFNEDYRTSVAGYTSIDQVLTPFYMLPFLLIVDQVGALRRQCVPVEERHQTFFEAMRSAYAQLFKHRGRGLLTVFSYRLLINARAMAYFYLSVQYDLAAVYLELTLVRIVLSWVMALFVCVARPGFIGLGQAERNTIFHPLNLCLKVIGTGLIIGALLILDGSG